MSDLIVRTLNDKPVGQRQSDRYVNATQFCKAEGKLWGNYWQTKETQAFIWELSRSIGIPIDVLVKGTNTGPNSERGTWVHPRVAYHLGQWCSPKAAVQVTEWLEELHTTGTVSLRPQKAMTTNEMFLWQAQINVEMEQKLLAQGEQIAALQEQVTAITDRQPPAGKSRIEDWLRRQSKPYLPKDVLAHLRAACREHEAPELFRPDGFDYPLPYFSHDTIAAAYEQVTRQLSFFARESRIPGYKQGR
jgi:hypothetical protein